MCVRVDNMVGVNCLDSEYWF